METTAIMLLLLNANFRGYKNKRPYPDLGIRKLNVDWTSLKNVGDHFMKFAGLLAVH